MGKTLNENWHISTILKRVCSVIQHHWARSFRWLSVASLVCNTSNETILNQLPESSSHGESCKCTRGQGGEEWPEETRLHSWWRHWVLQQWHCGTTTLEHSRLELPTSSLEWWWESLMEKSDGEITSIPDIGAVMEEECAVAAGCYMEDAVIGVVLLDTYSSCCICKSNSKWCLLHWSNAIRRRWNRAVTLHCSPSLWPRQLTYVPSAQAWSL